MTPVEISPMPFLSILGSIPNALDRPVNAFFDPTANEYAPVAGITELRQAVADLYNHRYRKDKESKYTWKNVCITPGGRASLTRVAAAIGNVYVGFFLPEYTAYEEMLAVRCLGVLQPASFLKFFVVCVFCVFFFFFFFFFFFC